MCAMPRKPTRKSKWPKLHRAWAKQQKAARQKGLQLFPTLFRELAKCGLLAQVKFSSAKGTLTKNNVLASEQVSTMREEEARSLVTLFRN